MSLQKLLKRPVETIAPDASCAAAARQMADKEVGCLVVVDGEHPVGIITDRDLVVTVLARGRDAEQTPVKDACSGQPIMLKAGRGLDELIDEMSYFAVRRVPILDEDQKLLGVLSIDDVFLLLSDQLKALSRAFRRSTAVPEESRPATVS